jgi:hypothetical protein
MNNIKSHKFLNNNHNLFYKNKRKSSKGKNKDNSNKN